MSDQPAIVNRLGAEVLGTFILVLGGVGTAVFAADYVGFHGVALAFGLTVVAGAYAFGAISGGHFNPAVSIGAATAGRFDWKDVPVYIGAQIVGGVLAVVVIVAIGSGSEAFERVESLTAASNGYDGDFFSLPAVLIAETVLTAVFVWVILGVTSARANATTAGLTIGLTLTLIHLISIPISNTSVNPARSLAPAIFAGGDPLAQVWVFFVAPIAGALIAGLTFSFITGDD